jgi:hypothetical protein
MRCARRCELRVEGVLGPTPNPTPVHIHIPIQIPIPIPIAIPIPMSIPISMKVLWTVCRDDTRLQQDGQAGHRSSLPGWGIHAGLAEPDGAGRFHCDDQDTGDHALHCTCTPMHAPLCACAPMCMHPYAHAPLCR